MSRDEVYQGGSGLRGVIGELVFARVGVGSKISRKMEQLLSLRNSPKLSDAASDWRISCSLHGRLRSLLLIRA